MRLNTGQVKTADVLHRLLEDWQIISDAASTDLVLWMRESNNRFRAVYQARPAGGGTVHVDDAIGLYASTQRAKNLSRALTERQIIQPKTVRWLGGVPIAERFVPLVVADKAMAVVTLEYQSFVDTGWLARVGKQLADMMSWGAFPYQSAPNSIHHGVPRVSDGAVLIDPDGVVRNFTPNARSCFRRLGLGDNLQGQILIEKITDVIAEQLYVDEMLPLVVMGRAAWIVEVQSASAVVSIRSLPLTDPNGERDGALLLVRDVSEIRRREQELITKDATIREIHHRVKNNLQTVSALLRIQARRSDSDEVRGALHEAEGRIAVIAKVHEELSHTVDETVDFDSMIERLVKMSASMAATDGGVRTSFTGSIGHLDADAASALAVILSELVSNAVEHGFSGSGGEVSVQASREGNKLRVLVSDNGSGLPGGEVGSGLGTQIVQTLVASQLSGSISWRNGVTGGTVVEISGVLKPKK